MTYIGDRAFAGCEGMASIIIPDSVTYIGYKAFDHCDELNYNEYNNGLYLGNSNNPYVILVKAKNTEITSCAINEKTKLINHYAFNNCSSITNIEISNGVTFIGEMAFGGCSSLTSIEIPDSVTSIGFWALNGCSKLESLILPFVGASIKSANESKQYPLGYIFGTGSYTGGVATKQSYLGERYYGGDGFQVISETYYIPASLKSVTVTGGNILQGAFNGCSGLMSITIADTVTYIGKFAFQNCGSLTSITIPGVTYIGVMAFEGCRSLTNIEIPDGVTSIGEYAFYNCSNLTCIAIPCNVTSIGTGAFEGCNKIIQTENGVKYIDKWVINCDTSVTQVILRNDTKGIADSAFLSCNQLTSITIPNSVTAIGDYAFHNCSSLTSINIPDGVAAIGDYVFGGCTSLTSIIIPDGVTAIGDYAFGNCGLTNISIPMSVTSIGLGAFVYCSSLTYINFEGTKAQWEAIKKGSEWNDNTGDYTVHCKDGDIAKS